MHGVEKVCVREWRANAKTVVLIVHDTFDCFIPF